MSAVSVTVLVAVVVVAGLAATVTARRPSAATALVGRRLVAEVAATDTSIALLERWRDRATRWRRVTAVPVVLATLVASVMVRSSVSVGVGAHPAWSDPLLTGLLAVFLGAIAAELHHLRGGTRGRRTVELSPRDTADYLPARARRRSRALAGAALIVTALAFGAGVTPPGRGLAALGLAAVVPWVQRGIVLRARPAIAAELRAADDAVRRLAVRSVDQAGAGAVLLLTAWQLAAVVPVLDLPTVAEVAVVVAQLAAVATAIVWWLRSAPMRLLPDVPGALGAGQPLVDRP